MKLRSNTLKLGAAAVALALASPAVMAQDTIKLGLTAALTGPFNEFGEGIRRGAVLAIAEWNKNGGVDGKKVELAEALDDQLSPDRAVQNMRRILDNEEIVGIIAPAGSGPTLATIDMLEADGRPVCNPMAQAPQIVYPNGMDKPPRKNVFSLAITNEAESTRLGQLLAEKYNNVGILHESTAYGVTGSEIVKRAYSAANEKGKVTSESYNQRTQDVTAQLARLQRGNIDALLVIGLGADFAVIRRNMSRLNVDLPLYGSNGAATAPYVEGAGDLALGTRSVSTLSFGQRPLSKESQTFVDAYRAEFGTDRWYGPDAENPLVSMASVVGTSYDCVSVLLDGIKRAGTTDPAKVVAAIEETKNLPGASIAAISFSPTEHEALKPTDLGLFVMTREGDRTFLKLAED